MSYYKLLFIINAIVVAAFGLFLLLAPATALRQFNMDRVVTVVFLARVLGAALVSLGALLWFSQSAEENVQKFLGMAALGGAVLALIVTLLGVVRRVIRANGWLAIILELLFILGYIFVVFLQPRMVQREE